MIEEEVLDILRAPLDDGKRVTLLADQFRQGRDINDLLCLLESENQDLVAIGAWIVGEVLIEQSEAGPFILRLKSLLEHEAPLIRWRAINALWPLVGNADSDVIAMLKRLALDSNAGVRDIAQRALDGSPDLPGI